MRVDIRRLGPEDEEAVFAARSLFDDPPERDATRRFLTEPTHHLLLAYDGDGKPLGFVSGVETTHPDKGTEMFLYELGVDAAMRRRGVGRSLVEALAALAEERGCYGMWTATDDDNIAAVRTYRRSGAGSTSSHLMLEWRFGERGARVGPRSGEPGERGWPGDGAG
jgi:ribosomal protein S18 acetylase RimI-like enzyme